MKAQGRGDNPAIKEGSARIKIQDRQAISLDRIFFNTQRQRYPDSAVDHTTGMIGFDSF